MNTQPSSSRGPGTEIEGDVTTVNGDVRLDGTLAHGSVETYSGSVALRDGTRAKRDLVVERSRGLDLSDSLSASDGGRTMPRHRTQLLLAVLIALFARGTALAESKTEKIDQLLSLYHAYGHLNGAVLVADSGEVVYRKAFGTANLEWGIPAAVDTRFRVYSIAKQFTSMLVMQLVAEGKVKLDGKLADYLPYYRKDTGARITIHNLLNHTHGITPPEAGAIPRSSRFSFAELIRTHYSNDLEFEPGTSFRYGIGHNILAAIIEEVTGKPFEEVLKERILDPLGMKDTGYEHNEKVTEKLAGSYRETNDGMERRPQRDLSQSIGASGMYSTLADLFLWDQGLRQDKLVPRKYRTLMYEPHNPDWARPYGYGWNVHRYREGDVQKTLVSHDGGGVAFIYRAVEDNATVILLGNVGRLEYKLYEMSERVMRILQGTPYSLPKRSMTGPLLEAFAERGVEALVARFRELAASQDQDYDFSERALNSLGYRLLGMGEPLAAIAVFELNVERYPESANVYDSLAEAYMTNGDRQAAIENYQRSLDLDPGNTNAVQKLRELRETEEPEGSQAELADRSRLDGALAQHGDIFIHELPLTEEGGTGTTLRGAADRAETAPALRSS